MSHNDSAAGPKYEDAYQGLHDLALRRARSIVRNDLDAEEIAQEALLETYTSWAKIAHRAEAWVTRVATNRAIDRVRRAARAPELSAPADVAEPETARLDVLRALATLPLRQRQVAVLRHVADLGEAEAAGILDISAGAVKRHLHRATATLRDLPSLASGYQHQYDFDQRLRAMKEWMAENIIVAPEPPGGWPAPPWDHCYFGVNDHGIADRLAVDEAGEPLLDAEGDEVATGPGFGFVLCKLLGGLDLAQFPATLPVDALDGDAEAAFARARVVAMRLGHASVGDVHLGIALAERLPDPEPLDLQLLLRGVVLHADGPHADARLALYAERDAAGWTRPERDGALEPLISGGIAKTLKTAAVQASRRGERANCGDLLNALLLPPDLPPPPPPPTVIRTMELGRQNRIPPAIEE